MYQEKLLDKYLCSDFEQHGTLFEIFGNKNYSDKISNFVVPFGKEENGDIVYQDLSQISHMLISGTTGSGKTAFIQSIMTSLMLSVPTGNVKFIIYDSKQIDYMFFQGIPQLLVPILTDSKKAMGAINWALSEANNRIKLFTESTNYINELPHIFIILDDYSSIASCDDIECLVNLLNIGRQTNIHCILSTSTPTSSNVSTETKANIPCRIAFHTTQKSISRMIIDENGAELLQIPGEMIFKGQNQLIRCTSFYIADEEIKRIVMEIKCILEAVYDQDIIEFITKNEIDKIVDSSCNIMSDIPDELFEKAIAFVVDAGQASVAMLQRKLKIGYQIAARLIDQMEEQHIIGPYDGTNPRKILIKNAEAKGLKIEANERSNNNKNLNTNFLYKEQIKKVQFLEEDRKTPSIQSLAEQAKAIFEDVNMHTNEIFDEIIKKDKEEVQETFAELLPFPKLESCGESVEIKDNLIYVKKITKRQGPYIHTAEYTFDNRRLCGVAYTKPKLFSKGSFTFVLKPNSWNVTDQRIDKKYESDLPKTELSLVVTKNNAVLFENLAKQLAKDGSIEVTYN